MPRRYSVFISYRHADNKEPGRQWANWLHQALETYEVPPDLIGRTNSRGQPVPGSLYPVFRDEEELPADADLSRNIESALENSGVLVVLCSPRAVESSFVAREIRYFKELGKSTHILALMIDGEPNVSRDPAKRQAMPDALECLPEPLRFGVPADLETGRAHIDWSAPTEPIAADARPDNRPGQGYTAGAAYRESLAARNERDPDRVDERVRDYEAQLEQAKLKIIAGALGVPLGELTQRDKAHQLAKAQQRLRTIRRVAVAFVVLALLAVAGAAIALVQRAAARRETVRADNARKSQVQALADAYYDRALALLSENKTAEALPYVAASLRLTPDKPLPNRMAAALLLDPSVRIPAMAPIEVDRAWSMDFTPDGKHAVANWMNHPPDWIDLRAGKAVPLHTGRASSRGMAADFSPGGCAVLSPRSIWFWPSRESMTREAPQTFYLGMSLGRVAITSRGGKLLFNVSDSNTARMLEQMMGTPISGMLKIVDISTGKFRDLKAHEGVILKVEKIPGSDDFLTLGADSYVRQWTPETEKPVAEYKLPSAGTSLAISPNGQCAVVGGKGGKSLVIDLQTHKAVALAGVSDQVDARDVVFNPAGTHFAIGFGQDQSHIGWIRVWEAASGLPSSPWRRCEDWVKRVVFDETGKRIGYICAEGEAGVIDGESAVPLTSWRAGLQGNGVQFVQGTENLAVTVDERSLRIYPASADSSLHVSVPLRGAVRKLAVDSSGRWALAIVGSKRDQHVWISLDQNEALPAVSHSGASIAQAQFVGEQEDAVAVLIMQDGAIEVWDRGGSLVARRNAPLALTAIKGDELPAEGINMGGEGIAHLRKNPDVLLTAFTSVDLQKLAAINNEIAGQNVEPLTPGAEAVQRRVMEAFFGGVEGKDPRTLQTLWKANYAGPLMSPRLSRAGSTLIASDTRDARIVLWKRKADGTWGDPVLLPPVADVAEGEIAPVSALHLSDDGRWVLALSGEARVCDLEKSPIVWHSLAPGETTDAAVFSRNSPVVALDLRTNTNNGVVQLWDCETLQPVSPKLVHADDVNSLAFSADEKLLITSCDDNTARVWDVAAGRLALPPFKTTDDVNAAIFRPDGLAIIFGGDDKMATVAPVPPAERAPAWVPHALEALGGNRLDEHGTVKAVPLPALFEEAPAAENSRGYWQDLRDWLTRRPGSGAPGLAQTRGELLLQRALAEWNADRPGSAQALLREALRIEPKLQPPSNLARLHSFLQAKEPNVIFENWDGRAAGTVLEGPAGIRFRWCPPGRFTMGSPEDEPGHQSTERARTVTLTKGFWMSETEVTQAQWEKVMGKSALDHALERIADPAKITRANRTTTLQQELGFKDPKEIADWKEWFEPECPMVLVSATDAESFARKVNDLLAATTSADLAGRWQCGLPGEVQWEYACRAGTTAATYLGAPVILGTNNSPMLSQIAWYKGNASSGFKGKGFNSSRWGEREEAGDTAGIHPVGLKEPNAWGLYDMLGNVFEWCADTWRVERLDGEVDPPPYAVAGARVQRSGGVTISAATIRSAYRVSEPPDYRDLVTGFRVMLFPAPD